jgi:hypothetical protein
MHSSDRSRSPGLHGSDVQDNSAPQGPRFLQYHHRRRPDRRADAPGRSALLEPGAPTSCGMSCFRLTLHTGRGRAQRRPVQCPRICPRACASGQPASRGAAGTGQVVAAEAIVSAAEAGGGGWLVVRCGDVCSCANVPSVVPYESLRTAVVVANVIALCRPGRPVSLAGRLRPVRLVSVCETRAPFEDGFCRQLAAARTPPKARRASFPSLPRLSLKKQGLRSGLYSVGPMGTLPRSLSSSDSCSRSAGRHARHAAPQTPR